MKTLEVWTFFYGSYMNFDVLKQVDFVPQKWEMARLNGYDIRIEPRANLIPSDKHCVYGIIASANHDQLARLYAHAQNVLGEIYLPVSVLVETQDAKLLPALCYLAESMKPRPAAADYVDRILAPARQLGFPAWYIQRLEKFRPNS